MGGDNENEHKRSASFGPQISFFLFLSDFSVLTNVFFWFYLCFDSTRKDWVDSGDENEPKRRVLRRLGPR